MIRRVILIAVFSPACALAQEHQYSCPGQTQIDANFCAKDSWQVADDELNRIWNEVKPLADARGTGQSLLEEQRAWLQQRDAACEPEMNSGGSAAAMFYWVCMEQETLRRNAELAALR